MKIRRMPQQPYWRGAVPRDRRSHREESVGVRAVVDCHGSSRNGGHDRSRRHVVGTMRTHGTTTNQPIIAEWKSHRTVILSAIVAIVNGQPAIVWTIIMVHHRHRGRNDGEPRDYRRNDQVTFVYGGGSWSS